MAGGETGEVAGGRYGRGGEREANVTFSKNRSSILLFF
jgi:hypothetical protein